MDHRISEGLGANRPDPLAQNEDWNSWGPSWGLARVLVSSCSPLLPRPPSSPRLPLLSQSSSLESRPGRASAPTLSSASVAQRATAEQAHVRWRGPLEFLLSVRMRLIHLLTLPFPCRQLYSSLFSPPAPQQ
jgi:hypothetical protein